MRRRAFLSTAAVAASGCLSEGNDGERDGSEGGGPGDGTSDEEELDLREANVVGVSVEDNGGAYTFNTTLYHDDDGEDGYADRWVVETLGGDEVGRRELAHPHGTRRFTRSTTVATDASCVVVRGHDETHGYGGRAVVVDLSSDETEGYSQGGEPRSFGEDDCP